MEGGRFYDTKAHMAVWSVVPKPLICEPGSKRPIPGPCKPHDIAMAPTTRAREEGAAKDLGDPDDDGRPDDELAPAAIPIVDG